MKMTVSKARLMQQYLFASNVLFSVHIERGSEAIGSLNLDGSEAMGSLHSLLKFLFIRHLTQIPYRIPNTIVSDLIMQK